MPKPKDSRRAPAGQCQAGHRVLHIGLLCWIVMQVTARKFSQSRGDAE